MARKKPNFFIDAFYESKFKDNLFVVKVGGKIVEDRKILDNLISNIRDLSLHGIKILLIYGHGRAVDEKLEQRKIPVNKVEGRRVTDAATLEVIQEVVGGTLSLNIASSMAKHNVEGISLNAIPHDWMRLEVRPKKPIDYGFVGDVKSVESRPVARLFRTSNFVACSCVGVTSEGQVLNINADTIATQLAIGTKAHKLMFLSDVDGVQIDGKSADVITAQEIPDLIKKGIATGGMKVKLENCLAALNGGVRRIHLINGLREDALKKEIYESVGPGTMLFHESERASYANEVEAQKVIERQGKRA
ncbi:MAG: acetylglutamate kinase [Alphaproteobacteria bacterium]|jgi:acetylglutamate kinase|nr:acetylglutamate kinase [Alphaproteobacteria bacterium]